MRSYWFITGDFLKERSGRIGASDIPALIPNPEKPTETLAGYGRTPITVWQEKTGRLEREPAGLPAEMGHYLEGKILEVFVREFAGAESANAMTANRRAYEYMTDVNAGDYQAPPFLHSVQVYRDGMIVHPDLVFDPACRHVGWSLCNPVTTEYTYLKTSSLGITVRFDRPFLVEAKSAISWAAKRPEGSIVKGYDFKLAEWQGIPLKHYMQIQFQLALMEVEDAYLALLHDTSQFHVWHIRANRSHQAKLIDLAGKMVWHIANDTPPADLAMNAKDIMALYPVLGDDFAILNGEERDSALELAKKYRQAESNEKRWKEMKEDARDGLSVVLQDRPEIRDGEGCIAKWKVVKPSEKTIALSKIRNNDPVTYRYLKRKKCIEEKKGSRSVNVVWKGDE